MNKKGQMLASNTMYIMATIFAVGILTMLVINPVLDGYIKPALLGAADSNLAPMLETKYDFVIKMVKIVPYAIFLMGIIYLLVIIFRKERVSQYE